MSLTQLVDHLLRNKADTIFCAAEPLGIFLGVFTYDQSGWDLHTPIKDHIL